jgi:hypothetical protein
LEEALLLQSQIRGTLKIVLNDLEEQIDQQEGPNRVVEIL